MLCFSGRGGGVWAAAMAVVRHGLYGDCKARAAPPACVAPQPWWKYTLERLNVLALLHTVRFYAPRLVITEIAEPARLFFSIRPLSGCSAVIARNERWQEGERRDAYARDPAHKAVGHRWFFGIQLTRCLTRTRGYG